MIDAVPQPWLVGVQTFRVLGAIFLVLYASGALPGPFALPAGLPAGTYSLRVVADGIASNPVSFSTTTTVLSAPSNLTATAGNGQVTVVDTQRRAVLRRARQRRSHGRR